MKPVSLTFLLCAGILLTGACANREKVTTNNQPVLAASQPVKVVGTPDELAVARGIYQRDCGDCHGTDGSGGMKTIDGGKLNVPSLREGHALKHTDAGFVEQITEGGDGMPAFKDKISSADITLLVRMIRKDFQGQ